MLGYKPAVIVLRSPRSCTLNHGRVYRSANERREYANLLLARYGVYGAKYTGKGIRA
ncbi:hypothetical protein GCM10022414_00570 [Zhongshania borealis]|uniref:Uncharacterized protein n=1 Tax=Zhongshania borealis TaxID=889488 RepID=A0ABP7W680_9GAMM